MAVTLYEEFELSSIAATFKKHGSIRSVANVIKINK